MESKLYKKFSFGLSLQITISEYKELINNYGIYINSVYFSLPLGKNFHTRRLVEKEYKEDEAEKKLLNILKLFKDNGIKLEVVLNQYGMTEGDIVRAIKYMNQNINFDSICILDEYLSIIHNSYPNTYLISSFNNLKLSKKDIKNTSHKYNQIVVGKNFMRDIELLNTIKEEKFDSKLLLNNGCSFNCNSCRAGSKQCEQIFNENKKHVEVQKLYAIQSFFPFELKKLLEKTEIDELKISNRPCTYEYLNNCLDSYINNNENYINYSKKNYYLWGRLGKFIPFYEEFDYNMIKKIKEDLWKNI